MYLTVSQIANREEVSRVSVLNWINTGALRAIKIGSYWAIDAKDYARFTRPTIGRPKEIK